MDPLNNLCRDPMAISAIERAFFTRLGHRRAV